MYSPPSQALVGYRTLMEPNTTLNHGIQTQIYFSSTNLSVLVFLMQTMANLWYVCIVPFLLSSDVCLGD